MKNQTVKKTPAEIQKLVDQTLDEMYAAGEQPTVRSLIERIGRDVISSTATASKYKRNYELKKQAKETELFERLGFSEEFVKVFIKELTRFNKESESQSKEIIKVLTQDSKELQNELGKVERKLESTKEKNSQQEKKINQLTQDHQLKIERLNSELKAMQQKNKELSNSVKDYQAQVRQLKEEVSKKNTEIIGLQKDLEHKDSQIEMIKENYLNQLQAKERENDALKETLKNLNTLSENLTTMIQKNPRNPK